MRALAASGPLRLAPASGAPPTSLVILLHGYGANGLDLIGLGEQWRRVLPATAFVAPDAPEPCPGSFGGFQWWAISSFDRAARAAGAASAAPVLNAFIDAELARYGLAEDRLALVGFSQGTMMAFTVGPARARPLAGIVGFSGMVASPESLAAAASKPPVLLVHGDADPMIPVAACHAAETALKAAGFSVESHISPGLGHGIDNAGLVLGARFLARVLA